MQIIDKTNHLIFEVRLTKYGKAHLKGPGRFYFVIKSPNGKTLATSETYNKKQSAFKTINKIASTTVREVYDKT